MDKYSLHTYFPGIIHSDNHSYLPYFAHLQSLSTTFRLLVSFNTYFDLIFYLTLQDLPIYAHPSGFRRITSMFKGDRICPLFNMLPVLTGIQLPPTPIIPHNSSGLV